MILANQTIVEFLFFMFKSKLIIMIKFLEVQIVGSRKMRIVNLLQVTSYARFENVSVKFTKVLLNKGQKLIVNDGYENISDRFSKLLAFDTYNVSRSTVESEQKVG